MAVVRILAVSGAADTSAQGDQAFVAITQALRDSDLVTVSFAGVSTATSSFVNVAFVPLLSTMSFDEIKRRLRVVQSTRQINHMVKGRLTRQALEHA